MQTLAFTAAAALALASCGAGGQGRAVVFPLPPHAIAAGGGWTACEPGYVMTVGGCAAEPSRVRRISAGPPPPEIGEPAGGVGRSPYETVQTSCERAWPGDSAMQGFCRSQQYRDLSQND